MTTTHDQVWERCLNIIRDIVEWQPFKTWFEPIKSVQLKDNILTIQVPSQFFYEYLEEHYVGLLGKAIKRELGKEARLEYRIVVDGNTGHTDPLTINMPTNFKRPRLENDVNFPMVIENPVKNPFVIPGLKRVQIESQLNPNYTFDTFIEGECNRVARRAGKTIAAKPGLTSFNPLVIYGGVGLGKTHLAQAIGNEVKLAYPSKAVLYVSAEKFINQFIDSVR
ncbi:MAG: DnaA ATPase domain-containing protein, partial [Chitinophagaceae bacterium]